MVKDLDSKNPPIESVPVVRKFPEVFPNNLPKIHLEWEINFVIHMLPHTKTHFNSFLPYGSGKIGRVEGSSQRFTRQRLH